MESLKEKVNLKVNGKAVSLKVPRDQESLYREASSLLHEKLIELQHSYGASAKPEQILTIAAVDFAADALLARKDYDTLRADINSQVNNLHQALS